MHAAKHAEENKKILHDLIPLNSLSDERFAELSEKISIEVVKAGRYIFRKGDRDSQTAFLLEGTISLIDGFRKVVGELRSGTEEARHPVDNQQPRQHSARAVTRSVIARIDSGLLDVYLSWDPSTVAEALEIEAAEGTDWMTRMLQSKAFVKLPPSLLQALLTKFRPIEVRKGDVIIAQGGEGKHFYTIHEGRCAVTRRDGLSGSGQQLATLNSGDSFGEEALVSDAKRNATVTMLTDGLLMRLAKQDFVDLLKAQLVKYIAYEEAQALVESGAVWVDVRSPEEYGEVAFDDSVNIPLNRLRGEMPELVYNAKYVICCDNGVRSDSAAFMLSHRGFDVYVLAGGMDGLFADEGAEMTGQSGVPNDDTRDDRVMAGLEQERRERQRLEEQLELLRGELAESGQKLGEYYSRVNLIEEERRQFAEHIRELRENHSQQLQALSEELDQEKMRALGLRKSLGEVRAERDALRSELDSERAQSEVQFLQMQAQLEQALADMAGTAPSGDAGGDERTESQRLRGILHSVSAERRSVESRLDQLVDAFDAMRESVCRISEILPDAQQGGET